MAEATPPIVNLSESDEPSQGNVIDSLDEATGGNEVIHEIEAINENNAIGGNEGNEIILQESDSQSNDFSFDKEFRQCMEMFKVIGKNGQSER